MIEIVSYTNGVRLLLHKSASKVAARQWLIAEIEAERLPQESLPKTSPRSDAWAIEQTVDHVDVDSYEDIIEAVSQLNVVQKYGSTSKRNRTKRNELLKLTDALKLDDFPVSAAQMIEWNTYRKALRDLTRQPDWPLPVWPTPPVAPKLSGVN